MKKLAPLCWIVAIIFIILAFADHHANQRAMIKQQQDAAAREQWREDSAREDEQQRKLQAIRNSYGTNMFLR